MTTTVKYEANRCADYHTRRFTIEMDFEDEVNPIQAMQFLEELVNFKLDGRVSTNMREFRKLCRAVGKETVYSCVEDSILERN